MLTPDGLRASAEPYAGTDTRNPHAAELHRALGGQQSLLLQEETREIRLSDSTRFAEKARAAEVAVTAQLENEPIHAWQWLPGVHEARRAIDRIGELAVRHC